MRQLLFLITFLSATSASAKAIDTATARNIQSLIATRDSSVLTKKAALELIAHPEKSVLKSITVEYFDFDKIMLFPFFTTIRYMQTNTYLRCKNGAWQNIHVKGIFDNGLGGIIIVWLLFLTFGIAFFVRIKFKSNNIVTIKRTLAAGEVLTAEYLTMLENETRVMNSLKAFLKETLRSRSFIIATSCGVLILLASFFRIMAPPTNVPYISISMFLTFIVMIVLMLVGDYLVRHLIIRRIHALQTNEWLRKDTKNAIPYM